jgi:hypothetical protein
MKSYLLILISAMFLISFSGCKKKSFDPAGKDHQDFIGTWAGSISTFKNNQLLKEYGTMVIYPDASNNTLSGILFMKETSVIHEFQFVNGTLYFKVVNNDPDNPFCQFWSLGGFAVFAEEGKIDINISGNECGAHGSEFINWVGSMKQIQVSADSLKYFSFAKSGNSWIYKVTLMNGDTCQLKKEISQVSGRYLFSGAVTQTCGLSGQNMTFKWNVTPSEFSIIYDTTISYKPFTYPINAKPNVVYNSYVLNDTIQLTLLDTNAVLTTPAGTFSCVRFRLTEPVYSGNLKITRTAYIWLNPRYGVIRQDVVDPVELTDIQYILLTSKGF